MTRVKTELWSSTGWVSEVVLTGRFGLWAWGRAGMAACLKVLPGILIQEAGWETLVFKRQKDRSQPCIATLRILELTSNKLLLQFQIDYVLCKWFSKQHLMENLISRPMLIKRIKLQNKALKSTFSAVRLHDNLRLQSQHLQAQCLPWSRVTNIEAADNFMRFSFFLFLFFRWGWGQWKRERENLEEAPWSAWSRTWALISGPWDHDPNWNWVRCLTDA